MKRSAAAFLTVVALGLASAAPADAAYLSKGEFARVMGSSLLDDFRWGATRGSLYLGVCRRISSAQLKCHMTFNDSDGDGWCGKGSVRDVGSYHRVGWRVTRC